MAAYNMGQRGQRPDWHNIENLIVSAQIARLRSREAGQGAERLRPDGVEAGGRRDRQSDKDVHERAMGGRVERQSRALPLYPRWVHRQRVRDRRRPQLIDVESNLPRYVGGFRDVSGSSDVITVNCKLAVLSNGRERDLRKLNNQIGRRCWIFYANKPAVPKNFSV